MNLVGVTLNCFNKFGRVGNMRTRRIIVLSTLGILMLFSLSGCFSLPDFLRGDPGVPAKVGAVLSLDKDGVLKIDYMPCIKESPGLSGRYYVLDGLTVRRQCTPENPAACAGGMDSIMWWVDGPVMFSRDGVPLPQSLRYGDTIPHASVKVPPMPLQVNAGYRVVVKITGFKGQDKYGPTFSSIADFRIKPDGKGGKMLIERGGQSCGRY